MDNTNTIFYLGFDDVDDPIKDKKLICVENHSCYDKTVIAKKNKRDYSADGICYCRKCKSRFDAEDEIREARSFSAFKETKESVIKCPTCGTSCKYSDLKTLEQNYCIFRECYLYDNKVKINMKVINFNYYNKHLIPKIYHTMIVLNLKTGMSYSFPIYKDNKRDKHTYNNPTKLYNCTYKNSIGWVNFMYTSRPYSNKTKSVKDIFEQVYNYIREYNMNELDCYIPTFEENFKDYTISYPDDCILKFDVLANNNCELTYKHLTLFNRFPTVNPVVTSRLFSQPDIVYRKVITKTRTKIKKDCKDVVKSFLEINKIPVTHTTKKQTRENGIDYVIKYSMLQKIFSVDNIYKIIDYFDSHSVKIITEALKNENLDDKTKNNLCNKLKKESDTKSKWAMSTLIRDIFHPMRKVRESNPDYKINWKLSLKELHDVINADYNKLSNPNIEINYDHIIKKYPNLLAGEYGNLTFALAKDTHELIDVGNKMNICVGSYGKSAVNKQCHIVIATDKDKNPIICIELDSACFTIKQAKLRFNETCDEELTKIVLEWCKDNLLRPYSYDLDQRLVNDYLKDNLNELNNKSKEMPQLTDRFIVRHEIEIPDEDFFA